MRIQRRSRGLAAVLALAACAVPARAEPRLELEAPDGEVTLDAPLAVELAADLEPAVVGGGVEVLYDPEALELQGFDFAAGLPDDPDLRCPGAAFCPDPEPGRLFVQFGGIDGLSGRQSVGTLRFVARALGGTELALEESALSPFASLEGDRLSAQLPASVPVQVPEPGVLGTLAAALGLVGARRFRFPLVRKERRRHA